MALHLQGTRSVNRGVAKRMRRFSKRGLSDLMGIGDKLAALNVERFKSWARPFTADNSKAALLLFDGDVYRAMDVGTLSSADLTWTQDHLGTPATNLATTTRRRRSRGGRFLSPTTISKRPIRRVSM